MKAIVKDFMPDSVMQQIRKVRRKLIKRTRRIAEALGFNIVRKQDYYSPIPTESDLLRNIQRWNKPSSLKGVNFDLSSNKVVLTTLLDTYLSEFLELPGYVENQSAGFGPGYTELDAFVLYAMVRQLKPRRYLEVGSGLSTYYCCQAVKRNAYETDPTQITCIEPYPYRQLYSIPQINIIKNEVQNVDLSLFESLEAGDILFIDSSHILRMDGDVPFLFLEALPIVKPGVIIHIHDVPFPYNIPFPAEQWVTGGAKNSPYWPVFWNEAMLLQAFLAFNHDFEIILSAPLIRYYDEDFLKSRIPFYKTVQDEPNTFSSIWLKRTQ